MASVCVIGLPTQLRGRLEAACRRAQVTVSTLLAGKGKEGTLWLLPHPGEVIPLLHQYIDALPDYSDAHLVVLPYVAIPKNLWSEIEVLEEGGARVVRATAGQQPWPTLMSDRDFDERFRDDLFQALTKLLVPQALLLDVPSVYFTQVRERNPTLLLAGAVLRRCDSVTEDRYQFMRNAIDAFEALLSGDPGVSMEQFFGERDLYHAQSGPITAKVTVVKDGKDVYTATTEAHLKLGDATSQASAARIYYHRFEIAKTGYLAVLHAGPHPDRNMKVVFNI